MDTSQQKMTSQRTRQKIQSRQVVLPSILATFTIFLPLQPVNAVYQGCPDTIKNSYECAQHLEASVKRSGELKFVRKNGNLSISLKKGKKTYTNSGEDTEVKRFSLVNYLKPVDQAVIHIQFWENVAYRLLDLNTGKEIDIEGYPILSPDSRRIVSARMDIDIGLSPNSISIYRFENGKVVKEFTIKPDWGPSNPEWQGDSKILLKKNSWDTTGPTVRIKTENVYLILKGTEWRLGP